MNVDTGQIVKLIEGQEIPDNFIPIDLEDATEKQRKEMKVDLQDDTSILGKKRKKASINSCSDDEMRELGIPSKRTKNQRKRDRKKYETKYK